MGKYKLTPLEELRLEKKRLQEERDIAGQRLSYQMQYLSDNWGALIVKGVTASVRNRFAETVEHLTADSSLASPFFTKQTTPIMSLVMSNLPLIGGIVWKMAKPAVVAFTIKRITAMLFQKKKRK